MRKQKKRKYVARNTLQFQMNLTNEGDRAIIAIYEAAVKNRAALQMFRDAMRLLYSLQQKDLSVLFALFPELESQFSTETIDLIEEFRQMLHSEIALIPATAPPQGVGLKPLASAHIVEMPVFDESEDDDPNLITLVENTKAKEDNTLNFLNSALGFNS